MALRPTEQRWGAVAIGLHWATALLVLGLVLVGLLMQELPPSPTKVQVYALHKSVGLSVLALTALRLAWRLWAGAPAAVPGTPRWQRAVAAGVHVLLYAILLLMPLSGWLYNSASGFPLSWFGLFPLPGLAGYDPTLKALALAAHETLFWALAALAGLHAAAALWHQYRNRDATLARMLPGLRAPNTTPPPGDP